MSDGTAIEWADATWTVAVGCTRVSAGCDNCYAAMFVHRRLHETHYGLTKVRPKDSSRPGVDWNGVGIIHVGRYCPAIVDDDGELQPGPEVFGVPRKEFG